MGLIAVHGLRVTKKKNKQAAEDEDGEESVGLGSRAFLDGRRMYDSAVQKERR